LEVRVLNENDAEVYKYLRLKALSEEPGAFAASYEEEADISNEIIINRLREQTMFGENYILGAFRDGVLLGIVGFTREQLKKLSHKGYIWGMYVIPQARGEGIGKLLLEKIISNSKNIEGLEQLNLTVASDNKVAKKLYQRLGFKSYGVEKKALKIDHNYYNEDLMILEVG
jgi:ribosomal protein S18 acetylase RimI-like enzyme